VSGRARRRPHQPHHVGIGAAADLHLSGDACCERRRPRFPRADHQRHLRAERRVLEPGAGGEREPLAREAGPVAGQEQAHDRGRLPEPRQRPLLVEAELLHPGAAHEAEVGAARRGEVERRGLACDLDRVERLGVQRRRAEPHALRHAGDRQERKDRRLEEEILEDRDDVEARGLGAPAHRFVVGQRPVRLEAQPDLVHRAASAR
jgi:hypothetical protein